MNAGILLAAGESRRMGACKLLLPGPTEPLVRIAAGTLLEAGLQPVFAVLGHHAPAVKQALAGLPLTCIVNPRYSQGMGTSLAAGVAALPSTATCAVVALGDMPGIRPATLRTLLAACGIRGIVAPVYRGRRGHPVVFDLLRYRLLLEGLDGDRGARALLDAHPGDLALVSVDDPGILLDLDSREAYTAWLHGHPESGSGS